jgi:hypothetical protein
VNLALPTDMKIGFKMTAIDTVGERPTLLHSSLLLFELDLTFTGFYLNSDILTFGV